MPVVNYNQYCQMLENARKNHFAYPAINVTSMVTANAALEAFAEMKSDGIIELSVGGCAFASGLQLKDSVLGAISLANHIHIMAEKYDVMIAIHTDHCTADKIDSFLKPLIAETAKRRAAGLPNLFNSHMFDGSTVSLEENLKISKELMELCKENEIILEVEIGVVGGEEDGISGEDAPKEKLYSTPEDMIKTYEALSPIGGTYMMAATFGNVHGIYKPGNVVLKPKVLKTGVEALQEKHGADKNFNFVFHGGSGSSQEDIHETLKYGVVKMNVDTDAQYAFSRPVTDHILKNYDGMMKIEGEVGNKKVFDPRAYLKKGEIGMKERVMQAVRDLKGENTTLFGNI